MNEHLNCPKCNQPTPESLVDHHGRAYCEKCDHRFYCMTVSYPIELSPEQQAIYDFSMATKVIPYIEVENSKDLVKLKKFLSKEQDIGIKALKEILKEKDRKWELEEKNLHTVKGLVIDLKVNYGINLKIKTIKTD